MHFCLNISAFLNYYDEIETARQKKIKIKCVLKINKIGAARGPTDGEQRGAMPPAFRDPSRRYEAINLSKPQKSEYRDRTERMIGKLLVRRATVVAQCRAEPQTKKQQQILSFAHFSRYVTVSGHAQDIWVPPATCTRWGSQ